jgi:hypothetical protein
LAHRAIAQHNAEMQCRLATLATVLSSLTSATDNAGGLAFMAVGIVGILYALFVFHWRCSLAIKQKKHQMEDRVGPLVLSVFFVGAVLWNMKLAVDLLQHPPKS